MGVSGNKKKDRVMRCATTALNLTQDSLLWHCFGREIKKQKDMDSVDMFIRLIIFEFGLTATVVTDVKDLKYFKEEPLKSVIDFIIDGDNKLCKRVSQGVIDMLRNHVSRIRLDASFFESEYMYCFDKVPDDRLMIGLVVLVKTYMRIKDRFSKDDSAISKEEIRQLVEGGVLDDIQDMEVNKKKLSKTLKIKEEKIDEVIELLKAEAIREGIQIASSAQDIKSSS